MILFTKLRMWFWTKSRTINELIKLSRMIDVNSKKLAKKLEVLDQDKTYICMMPDATKEELNFTKTAFYTAAEQMKWTLPKILFINTELKEKAKERGNK